MSEDSFTEVTSTSYFSRIGGSIKGIFVGLILFILAFPLLFWNEGRSVKRYKTLQEGRGAVIQIDANQVDANQDGKLVHTSGRAVAESEVEDAVFGVKAEAIRLIRLAETYQWEEDERSEKKKKLGGGEETVTTYTYKKVWSSRLINSKNFRKPEGRQNPSALPFEKKSFNANRVNLGEFKLSNRQVSRMDNTKSLQLNFAEVLPETMKGKVKVMGDGYYVGTDPNSPSIGDARIRFQIVPNSDVSLVAKQVKNSFEPYTTKVGGQIDLLETGTHSVDSMFEQAESENVFITWILRLVGFFLMFIGMSMVFKPLSVLADIIPIFGDVIEVGTSMIAFCIALLFASLTIAIAWLFYRPVLSICLLVVGGGAVLLAYQKLSARKKARNLVTEEKTEKRRKASAKAAGPKKVKAKRVSKPQGKPKPKTIQEDDGFHV